MARSGYFNVLGRGYIQISNKLLVETQQTGDRLVDHTFPIVLWEERGASQPKFTIASCATMCLQMTGIDATDAGAALADALESLMLDNHFDVAYLHDKYPRDQVSANAFNEATYVRSQPFRFIRMKGQWPPPDICEMLLR